MALEIEAKMKLDRVDWLLARLAERGAVAVGEFLEVNTFFDTEDRRLLAGDRGLRLRISTNQSTGEAEAVLTYKGPNNLGPLKSREETEMTICRAEEAAAFLDRLGFVKTMTFEKKRGSFKLDGCKIEVDEVPLLGHFVEIEGPGEPAVMRVRDSLGLGDRPLIKASYIAMLSAYLQERSQPQRDVTF